MNRKQMRDSLRAQRGKGGFSRVVRKAVFGFYGRDLLTFFAEKRLERMEVAR